MDSTPFQPDQFWCDTTEIKTRRNENDDIFYGKITYDEIKKGISVVI